MRPVVLVRDVQHQGVEAERDVLKSLVGVLVDDVAEGENRVCAVAEWATRQNGSRVCDCHRNVGLDRHADVAQVLKADGQVVAEDHVGNVAFGDGGAQAVLDDFAGHHIRAGGMRFRSGRERLGRLLDDLQTVVFHFAIENCAGGQHAHCGAQAEASVGGAKRCAGRRRHTEVECA